IGRGALLDGARDLLHPLGAGGPAEDPPREPEAVDDCRACAEEREENCVVREPAHEFRAPPGRVRVTKLTPGVTRRGRLCGTSAFSASIARRASSRSRRSGASLPNASEASSEHVWRRSSETFAFRSSSTSCASENPAPVGSASDSLTGPHLLREDLLHRHALLVACDLPLCRVPLRDREPRCGAELLGNRLHPLDDLLESRTSRNRLPAVEIDQLARQPV